MYHWGTTLGAKLLFLLCANPCLEENNITSVCLDPAEHLLLLLGRQKRVIKPKRLPPRLPRG